MNDPDTNLARAEAARLPKRVDPARVREAMADPNGNTYGAAKTRDAENAMASNAKQAEELEDKPAITITEINEGDDWEIDGPAPCGIMISSRPTRTNVQARMNEALEAGIALGRAAADRELGELAGLVQLLLNDSPSQCLDDHDDAIYQDRRSALRSALSRIGVKP